VEIFGNLLLHAHESTFDRTVIKDPHSSRRRFGQQRSIENMHNNRSHFLLNADMSALPG
jgi:hypothetical protein